MRSILLQAKLVPRSLRLPRNDGIYTGLLRSYVWNSYADEVAQDMDTLDRLLVPLYRSGDSQGATGLANRLINFRNLEVVKLTTEISMEAARLRAEYGLRTPDAIHRATAIITRASGILTDDMRLKALSREGLSIWLFDSLAQQDSSDCNY